MLFPTRGFARRAGAQSRDLLSRARPRNAYSADGSAACSANFASVAPAPCMATR